MGSLWCWEPRAQGPTSLGAPHSHASGTLLPPGAPTTFRTGYLHCLSKLEEFPFSITFWATYSFSRAFMYHLPGSEGVSCPGCMLRLGAGTGLGWEWVGGMKTNANEYPGTLSYHACSVLGCSLGTWAAPCTSKSRISSCRTRSKFCRNLEKGQLCGWQGWGRSSWGSGTRHKWPEVHANQEQPR